MHVPVYAETTSICKADVPPTSFLSRLSCSNPVYILSLYIITRATWQVGLAQQLPRRGLWKIFGNVIGICSLNRFFFLEIY
jgi:hypothetical protein